MNSNLARRKDDKADDFSEDAREASRSSIDTENQLASSLITVTLAFVAIIATAISTSNVLYVIVDFQKYLILAALIIFCLSIIVGLYNYFFNLKFHRETSALKERLVDRVEDAVSSAELERIETSSDRARPRAKKQAKASRAFLLVQSLSVVLGLILTIAFVASLLFYTAVREDYTDDLPIYEEIMDDQAQ